MAKPYSEDLRERVVQAVEMGASPRGGGGTLQDWCELGREVDAAGGAGFFAIVSLTVWRARPADGLTHEGVMVYH